MNSLLVWLMSMRMNLLAIIYPKGSIIAGSHISGRTLASFYQYGNNDPSSQLVNFYNAFANYLAPEMYIRIVLRGLAVAIGYPLYCIVNGLVYVYTHLFGLFTLTRFESDSDIGHLVNDIYHFGVAIFILVFVCYVIIAMFDSAGYKRYKNILRNTVVIFAFLFAMPSALNYFGRGVNSIATHMFGTNVGMDTMAKRIFSDNVISVPLRMQRLEPGQALPNPNHELTPINHDGRPGIEQKPVQINLATQSASERNKWNDLEHESVPSFMEDYVGPEDVLSNAQLNSIVNSQSKKEARKGGWTQKLRNGAYQVSRHVPLMGGSNSQFLAGANGRSYRDVFENYMTGTDDAWFANGLGKTKISKFASMGAGKGLLKISTAIDPTAKAIPAFTGSYTMYHVNWFAIYVELIALLAVLVLYIYKLFVMFYKLVIMYSASSFVLAIHAGNWAKVKSWMMSIFSIYEMLVMDLISMDVTIRAMLFVHLFTQHLISTSNLFVVNNPLIGALLDACSAFALFMVSKKGINAIDSAVGPEGGGANSGSNFLSDMLALSQAGRMLKGAGHAVGSVAKSPYTASKFLVNGKNATGRANSWTSSGKDVGGLRGLWHKHKNAQANNGNKHVGTSSRDKGGQNFNGLGKDATTPKPKNPNGNSPQGSGGAGAQNDNASGQESSSTDNQSGSASAQQNSEANSLRPDNQNSSDDFSALESAEADHQSIPNFAHPGQPMSSSSADTADHNGADEKDDTQGFNGLGDAGATQDSAVNDVNDNADSNGSTQSQPNNEAGHQTAGQAMNQAVRANARRQNRANNSGAGHNGHANVIGNKSNVGSRRNGLSQKNALHNSGAQNRNALNGKLSHRANSKNGSHSVMPTGRVQTGNHKPLNNNGSLNNHSTNAGAGHHTSNGTSANNSVTANNNAPKNQNGGGTNSVGSEPSNDVTNNGTGGTNVSQSNPVTTGNQDGGESPVGNDSGSEDTGTSDTGSSDTGTPSSSPVTENSQPNDSANVAGGNPTADTPSTDQSNNGPVNSSPVGNSGNSAPSSQPSEPSQPAQPNEPSQPGQPSEPSEPNVPNNNPVANNNNVGNNVAPQNNAPVSSYVPRAHDTTVHDDVHQSSVKPDAPVQHSTTVHHDTVHRENSHGIGYRINPKHLKFF